MKFIIRDYLETLSEREGLDRLMKSLLVTKGFRIDKYPHRGEREYGVDIAAIGQTSEDQEEQYFLFVLKEGNIDRNNWDSSSDAIRPSINDIIDVYIPNRVPSKYVNKTINIIVVHNGTIRENVKVNWINFIENTSEDHSDIEIGRWGLDELLNQVLNHLITDRLLTGSNRTRFQKSLSLLGASDHDHKEFKDLVDNLMESYQSGQEIEILRQLNLLLFVIHSRCVSVENNIYPAIELSEYVLIQAWRFLNNNLHMESKEVIDEYLNIRQTLLGFYTEYLEKLERNFLSEEGLANKHINISEKIEYPIRTFNHLGVIGTIGMVLLEEYKRTGLNGFKEVSSKVCKYLEETIFNNPPSANPIFDNHINDINICLCLLLEHNRISCCKTWIDNIISKLQFGHKVMGSNFPVSSNSIRDYLENKYDDDNPEMVMSTLVPILAEWCVILEAPELYKKIKILTDDQLYDTTFQIWHPDQKSEEYLYSCNAMKKGGIVDAPIAISEYSDFEERMREDIMIESTRLNNIRLSFHSHNYLELGFVISRHFRTPLIPFYWRRYLKGTPFSDQFQLNTSSRIYHRQSCHHFSQGGKGGMVSDYISQINDGDPCSVCNPDDVYQLNIEKELIESLKSISDVKSENLRHLYKIAELLADETAKEIIQNEMESNSLK